VKWFKHQSDALDDSFIGVLMDEFGASGYLVWFGMLELIAHENGKNLTGKASFDRRFVVRKLRTKWPRCRQILGRISDLGRISWAETGNNLTFDCPKLLSMQDNYSKNLQATRNKVSSQEGEEEIEGEKEKDTPIVPKGTSRISPISYSKEFMDFWNAWPAGYKAGKDAATKAFERAKQRSGLNGKFIEVIILAIEKQKGSRKWQEGYIKNPATWLNQGCWNDEIEGSKTGDPVDEAIEKWARDGMTDEEYAKAKEQSRKGAK